MRFKVPTVRVLLVSPRVSGASGVGQHVRCLAKYLVKKGHEVELLCSELLPCVKVRGLMNPSFTASATLKLLTSLPYPPSPYDVVHAHNVASALPMKAAWAKRRVLTLHGVFGEQASMLHRWVPQGFARAAELVSLRWADRVTAVSMDAVKKYSAMGFKVSYVPNAVDPSELPSEGLRLYERQVVYVGRLSREKGVDLLVEAFRELPHVHLLLIGGGPEEARIKALTKGLSNVHLLGPLPRRRALAYVKGSDLLVQPSRREGLSTAVLEAMAMGVPVVATPVGGNAELIQEGVTGLFAPVDDPLGLAFTIAKALESPARLRDMAAKARLKVMTQYSWDRVVEEYLKLYEG
ncbi:MAG: hypothetical protein DRJ69_03675 [Thermoprotei archaeon]|nr:MAG: hypothetical protein DRJ69_03675 [Thermoprotei archaeon]